MHKTSQVPQARCSYPFKESQMSSVLYSSQHNIFICPIKRVKYSNGCWSNEMEIESKRIRTNNNVAYLHSSQGMASVVQTGSSTALIQRSGIDTDCT